MKRVTGIVAALIIGSLSAGAYAAEELQRDKVAGMNLTKVGDISIDQGSAPMDAKEALSKKADEIGGKYFVVTSGQKHGDKIHATAEVYK
ncbi:YdgH/BhsA/McbA-like domain containing protein [Siccibacter turicensis]|uniref:YdgH/BhsA/McbA-like domain containing protein n=1 Tax=Siccibacter turicensis TaxID=357233 RepID=UPI000467E29E|nr:YdgH/BhsA/McbA-like domain containing protein [Siccibacter turicensis]